MPNLYKAYRGTRLNDKPVVWALTVDGNVVRMSRRLDPRRSLKVYNHSPDGFEWGYGGSGPAQTALAILLDYTKNKKLAVELHQDFKWTFISKAMPEGFNVSGSEIDEFMKKYK